jgi:hypothetical protein
MGQDKEDISPQYYRKAAGGFGFLIWGFVFLVYVGVAPRWGAVQLLVPPPSIGWLLFLIGLARLPGTDRVRAAFTWAIAAFVLSLPAGIMITAWDGQQWYALVQTGSLVGTFWLGVGAVICLMGYAREFARDAGARGLAHGASLRSGLFLLNAMMPPAQLLAGRAIREGLIDGLWAVALPPVISALAITGIISYMGAFVRLCDRPKRSAHATGTPVQDNREATRELMEEPRPLDTREPSTENPPKDHER